MQSIGDAASDDPRLGGIGQERKKEINDRFVRDLFPKKTTWGLKVYYCLSLFPEKLNDKGRANAFFAFKIDASVGHLNDIVNHGKS